MDRCGRERARPSTGGRRKAQLRWRECDEGPEGFAVNRDHAPAPVGRFYSFVLTRMVRGVLLVVAKGEYQRPTVSIYKTGAGVPTSSPSDNQDLCIRNSLFSSRSTPGDISRDGDMITVLLGPKLSSD